MNLWPAVSSRPALQRFFARTDFVTSKTSISWRSGPDSAAPFKGSRPDRLVFMLYTLRTSQAAERGAHGKGVSLATLSWSKSLPQFREAALKIVAVFRPFLACGR